MPVASDKISSLPDDLLCFILSKIPIKEAVRCSVLSQRWRFLYTQIPQLTLSPYLLLGPVTPTLELTLSPYPVLGPVTSDPFFITKVDQIIFNILQWHSVDLKAFHLFNDTERTRDYPIDNQWQFSSQSVCKWVQSAADKNVQHLNLGYSPVPEILPPSLFSCTRLTTLKLSNHILTAIPTHFSGFNHLITCCFQNIELTDDSLACFTSHCPLLQTLEIDCCTGLQQPAISAPNLLLLEIMVYDGLEVLTIDCPEIKTIRLPMIDDLRVNGVLFHEISFAVVGLKMHQGRNVIGLELDSREDYTFSPQRFLEIVGSFKALKKLETHISALLERGNEMVVPLISLLQRLPHLEILITTGMSLLELARDQIPPCLNPPLANLRYILVEINEFDYKEMAVLGCLLRSAPALKMLIFELPSKFDEAKCRWFLNTLLLSEESLNPGEDLSELISALPFKIVFR